MGGSVFLYPGGVMDNDKALLSICALLVVSMVIVLALKLNEPSSEGLIKNGKYWSTDCTLKEISVSAGVFRCDINRLDCSGGVVNVVTDRYDMAVSAYNKSPVQG